MQDFFNDMSNIDILNSIELIFAAAFLIGIYVSKYLKRKKKKEKNKKR